MTLVKEKAVTMIESLSDENVAFVIKIMQNLSDKINTDPENLSRRKRASHDLQQFRGRLNADIDYKKELSQWRDERYGDSC